jgi:hypothetical protein
MDMATESLCYFKNFHHALRENPRIDVILRLPAGAWVLKIKFCADKKRVLLALACGLILVYN